MNHARDFYIPNGRPKVLFMKPFRRDAWDLIVANALPDEYMWICVRHTEMTTAQVRSDLKLHPAKLVRIMTKGGLQ